MMRPIDATRLVKLVLEERDKIPLKTVERYSFGFPSPNKHGQSMRGGIRKALRIIEQAPTLDLAPVVHGEWVKQKNGRLICSVCGVRGLQESDELDYYCYPSAYCPNCGAKMDGGETDGKV